jgi:hypothetical protein
MHFFSMPKKLSSITKNNGVMISCVQAIKVSTPQTINDVYYYFLSCGALNRFTIFKFLNGRTSGIAL